MTVGILFNKTLLATELNQRRDVLHYELLTWVKSPAASILFAAHSLAANGMLLASKIIVNSSIRGGGDAYQITKSELAKHMAHGLANLKQAHSAFKDLELPKSLLKNDSLNRMELTNCLWYLTLAGVPENEHLENISLPVLILEAEINLHLKNDSNLRRAIFQLPIFPFGEQGILPMDGLSIDPSDGEGPPVQNSNTDVLAVLNTAEPEKRKRGRPPKKRY